MNFLSLLNVSVILCNSLESELIHEIDLVRTTEVFISEVFNCDWECGGVHHDLTLFGQDVANFFNDGLEVHGQQLICLIENKDFASGEVSNLLVCKVEDSSRSS
jgi:hypothetical protein